MNSSKKRSRAYYATVIEKSDYGVKPLDPDVYGIKKRATRTIKRQLEQANGNDDEFDDVAFDDMEVPSDSIITAQHLIKRIMVPSTGMNKAASHNLPPICFLHQIYSILRDNTAVDREIQYAVKTGAWRKFHVLGTLDDEYALMDMNDYLRTITEAKQEFLQDISSGNSKYGKDVDADLFDRFKQLLMDERYSDTTVSRKALLSSSPPLQSSSTSTNDSTSPNNYSFTDQELTLLCKYGLLLPHMKKDSYWFAIRRQGVFMSSFIKGRKEMLRILKKRSTKDIMEKLLKNKKLRQTIFSHEFILHDLIGSGRAERYKTSMGDLIKLTRKGELGQ